MAPQIKFIEKTVISEEQRAFRLSYRMVHQCVTIGNGMHEFPQLFEQTKSLANDLVNNELKNLLEHFKECPVIIGKQIIDIAEQLKTKLNKKIRDAAYLSIHIHKMEKNYTEIIFFIRGITKSFEFFEDLLELPFPNDVPTFRIIIDALVNLANFGKLVSVTVNESGFLPKLNKAIDDGLLNDDLQNKEILAFRCKKQKLNVFEKSFGTMKHVTDVVMKLVGYKKNNESLLSKLICHFELNETEYTNVPVAGMKPTREMIAQWCHRVYAAREKIIAFLKKENVTDFPQLENDEWLNNLAFLVDILPEFNQLIAKFEDEDVPKVQAKHDLAQFKKRLNGWKNDVKNRNFASFKLLKERKIDATSNIKPYKKILKNIYSTVNECNLCDFLRINVGHRILSKLFLVNYDEIPKGYLDEVIAIRKHNQHRNVFEDMESKMKFFKTLNVDEFPKLTDWALRTFVSFYSNFHFESTLEKYDFMKYSLYTTIDFTHDEQTENDPEIKMFKVLVLKSVLRCVISDIEPDFNALIEKYGMLYFYHRFNKANIL